MIIHSTSWNSIGELSKEITKFYIDTIFYSFYQKILPNPSKNFTQPNLLPIQLSNYMNESLTLIEGIVTESHVIHF